MEPKELEKNLGDLEEKLERVRALYEQYFVGIEKLEPQIPRKDVDRIIAQMRKEQIRNTAMRFKFQTLVQRYNTMQQHWGRILREIENGTYKRDLLKAAARFGVEDALTAAGRKHASRLRNMVDKGDPKKKKAAEEIYEELSASDYEVEANDDDDNLPTPPPHRVDRHQTYDIYEPPTEANAPMERTGAPSFQLEDPLAGADSIPPPPGGSFAATSESPAFVPPAAKKKGGLRWGGGGGNSRRADPEALKRMASLAGVDEAPSAAQPEVQPIGRRPLMSSPIDLGLPDDSVDDPAPAPPPVQRPQPREPEKRPLLAGPLDLDLGGTHSEPPPPPVERKPSQRDADAAREASAEAARKLELQRPKPALRPPPSDGGGPKPPPSSRREFGDLNDVRLRELYGQYVEKRRERNESTAGITFEKLADSLKTQAEKLKSAHGKRVDYEIVVKDGKTLIKPIVK